MAEPPPPLPPKELPINRFKFIWRVLMISNLALGAYMFVGVRKKDVRIANKKAVEKDVKNHKSVVEVPSDVDEVPPASPTTTTTVSKTWDM